MLTLKSSLLMSIAGMALSAAILTGCSSDSNPQIGGTASSATGSDKNAASDKSPGLKELDPADRAIAEKQKTCPISDEPLGSMGKPFKVTYKDRVAFLCCDGCKDKFDKEPEKWLKKIDDAAKK